MSILPNAGALILIHAWKYIGEPTAMRYKDKSSYE